MLVWPERPGHRALSLHAWEPLTEAAATLVRVALSAVTVAEGARLDARSDGDGVLYVDGSGWTCGGRVLVVLPAPWAETRVQPDALGVVHLRYARPPAKPYAGTVTATQRCGAGAALRARAEIVVGDRRAGG